MNQERIAGKCHVKTKDGFHTDVESEISGTDDDCKIKDDADLTHVVRIHNHRYRSMEGVINTSIDNGCLEYEADGETSVEHECEVPPSQGETPPPYHFGISQCDYGPETEEQVQTRFSSTDDASDFDVSPLVRARVELNEALQAQSD